MKYLIFFDYMKIFQQHLLFPSRRPVLVQFKIQKICLKFHWAVFMALFSTEIIQNLEELLRRG